MRFWLLCVGVAFFSTAYAADVTVVEEIVCKVNGDIITRTELEKDRKDAESRVSQQGLTGRALQEAVDACDADLLRERIDRLLLVQKGKELDLKVDAERQPSRWPTCSARSGIADPEKFQAIRARADRHAV